MVKAEWGTKRTCPKCGTRFYDLQKDDPVTCIDDKCKYAWHPEPVLKSKQPMPFDEGAGAAPAEDKPEVVADDDLDLEAVEDADVSPDDDVDLGGDDDLGVDTSDDQDEG